MKFLKGLALGLLCFLLPLSLAVFGSAFTLNSTVLNPGFLVSELDNFDVSLLTEEILSQEVTQAEFPEELRVTLVDTIAELEPVVKEQVGAAIYSIYDYLLGKSENLDLKQTLGDTLLSPEFVTSLMDKLDLSSLAAGFIGEQLTEEIPAEMGFLVEQMDDIIAELEPTIKEELSAAAEPIMDYLLGKTRSLNIVISLGPIAENLEEAAREGLMGSLAPELAGFSQAQLEQYFDEYFQEFMGAIPSTIVIDENMLGTEVPAQITEALAQAEEGLAEARLYVGYFQLGYKLLIGFILLLILGIVLIDRQVNSTTRRLGSIFLYYAIPVCIGLFAIRYFDVIQAWILQLFKIDVDVPAQLQALILQSVSSFLTPLWTLGIGLLITGVALIVVSYVYKPRQPSE